MSHQFPPLNEEGQLSIDIFQTETELVVQSTVAGVSLEELEIFLHHDTLIIRGTRCPPQDINPEDYLHRECYWGSFSRTIILPADVDRHQTKASLHNGVLTISLPRKQDENLQRVLIEGASYSDL